MTDPRTAPLGRQPALDGLRAVAVLAVLGFHANVSWLGGGFLGVDVFFVLSGFLITRLLLDEQTWAEAIGLARFYVRRALRLLPALAVLTIAVLIYAEVHLDPSQVSRALHDAFATATYHMNWRQALTDRPPFGRFDHTWSLAIEEQFYIAWPLLLVLVVRRWGARGVAIAAGVGALASWIDRLALFATGAADRRIYYGLDAHADGLLLGALLATVLVLHPTFLRRSTTDAVVNRRKNAWGLGALVVLGVLFTRAVVDSAFVDTVGYGLLAVLVAAVILDVIAGGTTASVLGWGPLVAIGRISYGLYLWHWPVYLAITAGEVSQGTNQLLAVRLLVTFALAIASWFVVERPALALKRRFEPPSAVVGAAGSAAPTR